MFPQSRYAYADVRRPTPWYICDRCGFRRMMDKSAFQHDWRGNQIVNLRLLVCTETCLDIPQPQLRPILVGPDPLPVKDARPGFAATQQGYTVALSPLELVSDDGGGGGSLRILTDDLGNPITDDLGIPVDLT